ncbi:hypothetical protein [Shumkonia mesophila]|uniref:hypothetical protein n=1 Tax=Shumkonia mesophila TaxID=2838854 RepID=UPI0029344D49|nr:hypothetical protein [Shumkonia mesophila]
MIEIKLPDGRVMAVDTDDPAVAESTRRRALSAGRTGPATPGAGDAAPVADFLSALVGSERPGYAGADGPNRTRGLMVGTQGVGRGLADIAGSPADLSTGLVNALLWGADKIGRSAQWAAKAVLPQSAGERVPDLSVDYRFPSSPVGSDAIAGLFSNMANHLGVPVVDEQVMTPFERAAYNVNRIGTDVGAGAAGLVRGAMRQAPNALVQTPSPSPAPVGTARQAPGAPIQAPDLFSSKPTMPNPFGREAAPSGSTPIAPAPSTPAGASLRVVDVPPKSAPADPAIEAVSRLRAAEKSEDFTMAGGRADPRFAAKADSAVDVAEYEFAHAVPTTDAGRIAKVQAVQRILAPLRDGGELLEAGVDTTLAHLRSLRQSIERQASAANEGLTPLQGLQASFEKAPFDPVINAAEHLRVKADALKFQKARDVDPIYIAGARADRAAAWEAFIDAIPTTGRGQLAKIDVIRDTIYNRGANLTEQESIDALQNLDALWESIERGVM